VRLTEGRIGLRPIVSRDAGRWAKLRRENAEWLGPWESTRPPESSLGGSGYKALIRDLRRQAREGRALPFVITYDGAMVGQLTVTGISWGSARWAQIGYWIDQAHAGRGITPMAVAMAVDHCLFTMHLHRIEIAIRPENANSLRVVEKLGFTKVGLSARYLHINGAWRDHLLFAVTVEELPEGLRARLRATSPPG
jgi:ribosomal-protein-alanine N-acetyltransferase